MRPIPVVFHIGPMQIHTYGIGLAITYWFGYRYFFRRCIKFGFPTEWIPRCFFWVVVNSVIGARAVHVVANFHSLYEHHLADIFAIWHGGLSSFGGLAFGIATGVYHVARYAKGASAVRGLDIIAPTLMAAWGLGRLLGPQLMVAGGGRPTTAWYGMKYAGQVGYRLPAPVFQSIESFAVFGLLILLERYMRRNGIQATGMIIAGLFAFWGVARFFDELLWLDVNPPFDAVEVTGIVMSAGGFIAMAILWSKRIIVPAGRGGPSGVPPETQESLDQEGEPHVGESHDGEAHDVETGKPELAQVTSLLDRAGKSSGTTGPGGEYSSSGQGDPEPDPG